MSARRVMGVRRIGERLGGDTSNPVVAVLGNGGTIARTFPGYRERRPQLDLAAFVAKHLAEKRHVLGEAGTGVGKSFAYLVAAILSGEKTVVAVPTIALQEQLISKDLPFLATPGVMPKPFTYALLKGRRNYVCRVKMQQYAETVAVAGFKNMDDAKVWPAVSEWYQTTRDGDLGKLKLNLPVSTRSEITADSDECLGESCPSYGTCFGEAAKGSAASAQIIVTNYALLMLHLQLVAETGGMVGLLPDDVKVIVLDECHQLREKAANAFTKDVTFGRFEYIRRRIENLAARAQKAAEGDFMFRVATEIANAERDGREPREIPSPTIADDWKARTAETFAEFWGFFQDMAKRLEKSEESAMRLGNEEEAAYDALYSLGKLYTAMIEEAPSELAGTDRQMWEKAGELVSTLIIDLIACTSPRRDTSFVRFMALDGETDSQRVVFSVAPIDVAPFLRARLWSSGVTVVSVSATVATGGSLTYYRETVGLDDAAELVVGSPFNYGRDTLLYVPSNAEDFNSTEARKHAETWHAYLDRLADEYERVVTLSRGRAFCLFTSRKVMEYVYGAIAHKLPYTVLKQGDRPFLDLIEAFKADGSAVLFAVKSAWEGVDVAGDALSCVIISGMPFTPPSDPVFAARCELTDRRYGRRASFRKISIPEATIALMQGFGRGKRTESDRVVIVILDGRLRTKDYGPGVLSSLPPAPITGDIADVAAFFAA